MILYSEACNDYSKEAEQETFSAKSKNQFLENKDKPICTASRVAFIASEPNHIYTNADTLPRYKSGIAEMNRFISKMMIYPKWEKDNHIHGNVFVQFVIEKDGNTSEFVILRIPTDSENLGNEAVRIIKLMPKWFPGKVDGHIVRTSYTIPMSFSLYGGYKISNPKRLVDFR